jgi:hypothetical protein
MNTWTGMRLKSIRLKMVAYVVGAWYAQFVRYLTNKQHWKLLRAGWFS